MVASRRTAITILAAAPLAACGFRPVYMPTASGKPGPAARELAAVHVDLIPDRAGQLLRQQLRRQMHGAGAVTPRYDLQVTYWITGEGIGILADTTATRTRLTAHAIWTLLARDAARTKVASGSATAFGGVNFMDTQYFGSDLETEQLWRQLAHEIAGRITLRLASVFRQRAG